MFSGISLDWAAIGQAAGAVSVTLGGVWAWILANKKKNAETRADVAEARTDAIVADANGTVYALLTKRLTSLEDEMSQLRADLARERELTRMLETRLARLDAWIRLEGMTPPTF